jgi:hypothetical protein
MPDDSVSDSFGHVIGIALIASGYTLTGVSFMEGAGGKPPPSWKLDAENEFAIFTVDTRDLFYHDLSLEDGTYWVGKLRKQALKPMFSGGEHAYSGWKDVPTWYLATIEDHALPIEAQRYFVQTVKAAGADVTLREVTSSHSPMLSRPKETCEYILEAVSYFVQNETNAVIYTLH